MLNTLAVALGGALGASSRYAIQQFVHTLFGRAFPFGTLGVNVLGSFAVGLIATWLLASNDNNLAWRAFLVSGFFGAFTTFSAFSIETLNLAESGQWLFATANIFLNVSLCLMAAWVGCQMSRNIGLIAWSFQ